MSVSDLWKRWWEAQRVKREDRRALQHHLDELDRQAHSRALRQQELDKAMEQLLKNWGRDRLLAQNL